MNQNSFHTKDVLGHILDVVENSKPTSLHRLAALLHDIGKVKTKSIDDNNVVHFYDHEYISKEITERFMKELKFSNEEIELVSSAVVNHMRVTSDITPKKIRKIRSELGDEKFEFLMDLCEADRLSHAENNIDHITKAREIKEKEVNITSSNLLVNGKEKEVNITSSNLLVNGKEIMEIFDLKPSKKVGELLNMVSDMMFENPNITKEEIIILLKNNNNENN
jgi:tRNA nucleotidyltransferase (CCA-adding enzyme)